MANPNSSTSQRSSQSRAIGLFVLGVGLLILSVAAFLLLPKGELTNGGETASVIPMEVSRPAPELVLEDLDGNPVSLSALRGQVVLVNNWATWCPPCRAEMPALEAYYQENRGKNFTLVAIDAGDPVSEVVRFAQSMELTFPIWMDRNSTALAAFNTTALPSSFVIDGQGTIRLAWTGAIDRATLDRYVTPLIEEGL